MRCIALLLAIVFMLGITTACARATPSPPAPAAQPPAPLPTPTPTPKRFEMPKVLVWTAYDVGSAGYAQTASIGAVAMRRHGITFRIVPAGTDVGRQTPLVQQRAQVGALGIASFLSQEGVMEFASTEWGPQEVYIIGAAWGDFNTGNVMCAADAGIKTISDLRGKRIAWVVGSPALNLNMTAFLAAAGLTWKDVTRVDFPSWGASTRAVIEGKADCAIASTNSGASYELANSPRKYYPPPLPRPEEDPQAWQRLKKHAPYFEYHEATVGAPPVSKENPHRGATYGYPILTVYRWLDEDLVYEVAKLVYESWPEYKDAYPGNEGFALERQVLKWVLPYHPGAVRYFKEKGVWTDEHERHNQELIRRQKVLLQAWEQALAEAAAKEVPAAQFPDLWMRIRAEALKRAGLDPYWEEKFW
jgi:TRAP transporter TAXI family solute receptor